MSRSNVHLRRLIKTLVFSLYRQNIFRSGVQRCRLINLLSLVFYTYVQMNRWMERRKHKQFNKQTKIYLVSLFRFSLLLKIFFPPFGCLSINCVDVWIIE